MDVNVNPEEDDDMRPDICSKKLKDAVEAMARKDYKAFPHCQDVSIYEIVTKIGHGTFGEVFKAKHRYTNNIVALKKILVENEQEGFPMTALREIKFLQALNHENLVSLIEVCCSKNRYVKGANSFDCLQCDFYLVFQFCEHDLAGLLSNPKVLFALPHIKMIAKQLLTGLYFLHYQKILHRDMKAANILITKEGILKIADFGLARAFSSNRKEPNRFTNKVVTLWYRPPELLLGARDYGPAIDLWGVGLIIAELFTRSPIMKSDSEVKMLNLISDLCGSIDPVSMPGVEKLDLYNKIELPKNCKRIVKERLMPQIKDKLGLDLVDKLLILDPAKRINSDNALDHDFFWQDPLPEDLIPMLCGQTRSNFDYVQSTERKQQMMCALKTGSHRRHHGAPNNPREYVDRMY